MLPPQRRQHKEEYQSRRIPQRAPAWLTMINSISCLVLCTIALLSCSTSHALETKGNVKSNYNENNNDAPAASSYLRHRRHLVTDPATSGRYEQLRNQLMNQRANLRIGAADFDVPSSVVLDTDYDPPNLSFLTTGDALQFHISIPTSGVYRLEVLISNPEFSSGRFWTTDVETDTVWARATYMPPTRAWDQWATVRVANDLKIPAGDYHLQLLVQDGGWNLRYLEFTMVSAGLPEAPAEAVAPPQSEPTNGEETETETAVPPATTEGDANTNNETSNSTTPSRPAGSGNEFILKASDFEWSAGILVDPVNGNVEQTDMTNRILYSIPVPQSGTYQVQLELSSPQGLGSLVLINPDTMQIYSQLDTIPPSGGWHNWMPVPLDSEIGLPAGDVPLEILIVEGGFNLLYLNFVHVSSALPAPVDPSLSSAADSQFLVRAGDFVASHGVVMEGPHIVAKIQDGASLTYPIDVPVTGFYTIEVRLASPEGVGRFIVKNQDTQEVYGTVSGWDATGSWTLWSHAVLSDVALTAGQINLEIQVLTGGFNIMYLAFFLGQVGNATLTGPTHVLTQAVDFVDQLGVATETPFAGGFESVTDMDYGDYMDYEFELGTKGTYAINLTVATMEGTASGVAVQNLDTLEEYGRVTPIPPTGGWYTWQDLTVGEGLVEAGTLRLRVLALGYGWNLLSVDVNLVEVYVDPNALADEAASNATQDDAAGEAPTEPEDVAPANTPEDDSSTAVADVVRYFLPASKAFLLREASLLTSATGREYMGEIANGGTFSFAADLATAGTYTISFRVAKAVGVGVLDVLSYRTKKRLERVIVPATGDLETYETIEGSLDLPAGPMVFQLKAIVGGFNFLWWSLELESTI